MQSEGRELLWWHKRGWESLLVPPSGWGAALQGRAGLLTAVVIGCLLPLSQEAKFRATRQPPLAVPLAGLRWLGDGPRITVQKGPGVVEQETQSSDFSSPSFRQSRRGPEGEVSELLRLAHGFGLILCSHPGVHCPVKGTREAPKRLLFPRAGSLSGLLGSGVPGGAQGRRGENGGAAALCLLRGRL